MKATKQRCQIVKASSHRATGTVRTAIARPTSQLIITRLRSHRSISAPTGKEKIKYGAARSAEATPAAAGEFGNASARSEKTIDVR
jgi:hypothetical protein